MVEVSRRLNEDETKLKVSIELGERKREAAVLALMPLKELISFEGSIGNDDPVFKLGEKSNIIQIFLEISFRLMTMCLRKYDAFSKLGLLDGRSKGKIWDIISSLSATAVPSILSISSKFFAVPLHLGSLDVSHFVDHAKLHYLVMKINKFLSHFKPKRYEEEIQKLISVSQTARLLDTFVKIFQKSIPLVSDCFKQGSSTTQDRKSLEYAQIQHQKQQLRDPETVGLLKSLHWQTASENCFPKMDKV